LFAGVSKKEKTIVREAVEEQRRKGKFKLIFPSDKY
jgi:hypothetical protein